MQKERVEFNFTLTPFREGIFRTRPVGYLGKRPMDRQWMRDIEERARRMKRACRIKKKADNRQGKLF